MGPLGWFGRLPAWGAGVLLGLVVGLPLAAWILWPVVTHRTEPGSFELPEPTYSLVTPSPSATGTPTPTATPRLTVIEQANEEWSRQEQDHLAREEAAVATRSVAPDRCCTRPPVAPQATAQPIKYEPAPAITETHNKPTPTPTPTPTPSPSPEPSDPTYTETPVYVDAYCGRSKIGLTAISVGPEGVAGTPVACTEVEGDLMPRWLPLPPNGLEAK